MRSGWVLTVAMSWKVARVYLLILHTRAHTHTYKPIRAGGCRQLSYHGFEAGEKISVCEPRDSIILVFARSDQQWQRRSSRATECLSKPFLCPRKSICYRTEKTAQHELSPDPFSPDLDFASEACTKYDPDSIFPPTASWLCCQGEGGARAWASGGSGENSDGIDGDDAEGKVEEEELKDLEEWAEQVL